MNDTLAFGSMLLFEATGGALGKKADVKNSAAAEEIPFAEKLKLFAALQSGVLLTHKVDPKKETSGLQDMRDLLNDSGETQSGSDGADNSIPDAGTDEADDAEPITLQ